MKDLRIIIEQEKLHKTRWDRREEKEAKGSERRGNLHPTRDLERGKAAPWEVPPPERSAKIEEELWTICMKQLKWNQSSINGQCYGQLYVSANRCWELKHWIRRKEGNGAGYVGKNWGWQCRAETAWRD